VHRAGWNTVHRAATPRREARIARSGSILRPPQSAPVSLAFSAAECGSSTEERRHPSGTAMAASSRACSGPK
jgi:hypothetical protein